MRRLIVLSLVAWIVVGRSRTVVPGDAAAQNSTQGSPVAAEGAIRRHAYLNLDGAWSVTAAPPLAFAMVSGKGLAVIDMSSPMAPRQIGFAAAPLYSAALVTVGGHVYGHDAGGLGQIIDVREPSRPRLAGTFEPLPGKGIWGLGTDGTRLFVLTADGQVAVLDLTDPVRPRRIGQIDVGGARGFSLAYGSGYVYATTRTGISVVDVRDPTAPRLHATVTLGFTSAILLAGEWLYVGVGRWWDGCIPGCWGDAFTLRILHVADGRPTEVARLPLSAYAWDLALAGQTLYVAGGVDDGVAAVDVVDPTRPRLVARSRHLDLGPFVATVGDSVLSSGRPPGLSVVDLESGSVCPEVAPDAGSLPPADRPTAARVYLPILAHGYDGCVLVEPTDLTAMLGGGAGAVVAGNSHVYVGRGPRVAAYEVYAGQPPRIVGWSPFLRGNVTALATAGRYVYAGDDGGAVTVIDFADPATPRVTGSWRPVLPILALAVWSGPKGVTAEPLPNAPYLFVSTTGSVTVLGVRDPISPQPVTTVDGAHKAGDLATDGRLLAAMIPGTGGFRIFDVSNPLQPRMIGDNEEWVADDVALGDDVAYLTGRDQGLRVVDLSDPGQPAVVWADQKVGPSSHIVVAKQRLYELAQGGRVMVYDLAQPREPRIIAEVPSGLVDDDNPEVAVSAMTIMDGLVILAGTDVAPGSLHVVDAREVGDPATPVGLDDLGNASVLVVDGHVALIADGETARLLDMSGPGEPTLIGAWPMPGRPDRLAISDSRAFVSWSRTDWLGDTIQMTAGLGVIDLMSPSDWPGILNLPAQVAALAVRGDFAYAMVGDRLLVVDAVSAGAPRLTGNDIIMGPGADLAAVGDRLFAASSTGSVTMLDLADPANPALMSEAALPEPFQHLVAAGSTLLAVRQSPDGPAIDVLRPDGPSWYNPTASWVVSAPSISLLAGAGRRAYVMADGTLYAYDIGQPALPALISRTPLPFDVRDLAPLGDHLAIATGAGGLRVVTAP